MLITIPALAQQQTGPGLPPQEAEQVGFEAYINGKSLITTKATRVQMSNVLKIEGFHAHGGIYQRSSVGPASYPKILSSRAITNKFSLLQGGRGH